MDLLISVIAYILFENEVEDLGTEKTEEYDRLIKIDDIIQCFKDI